MSSTSVVKTRSMSFSVRTDILDALTKYCKERGVSRSWFMSQALKTYLQDCLEDEEDYETAAAALREFERGDGKTYTTMELREEFGL